MTEISEKANSCRIAMKAAMEAIQDYCGTGEPEHGRYIRFAGDIIEYPESIQAIKDSQATTEDQIGRIVRSEWAIKQAKELVQEIEAGESSLADVVSADRIAAAIAEKIVA